MSHLYWQLWAFYVTQFYWVTNVRRRILLAYLLFYGGGYTVFSIAVSPLLYSLVGDHVGWILAVSSALGILSYRLYPQLNKGNRYTLMWGLPLYMILLLLIMINEKWTPIIWILMGPVNSVLFSAIDGYHQTALTSGELENHSKAETQNQRLNKSFTITSFMIATVVAVVSPFGLWVYEVSQKAWILSAVIMTACAALILRRTPDFSLKETKSKNGSKSLTTIYLIALPYLGVATISAFLTTGGPILISYPGLFLMIFRLASSVGYLLPLKYPSIGLVLGLSLLLLGEIGGGTAFLLLSSAITGISVARAKLLMKIRLYRYTNRKEAASATLATMSEAGYILGPLILMIVVK